MRNERFKCRLKLYSLSPTPHLPSGSASKTLTMLPGEPSILPTIDAEAQFVPLWSPAADRKTSAAVESSKNDSASGSGSTWRILDGAVVQNDASRNRSMEKRKDKVAAEEGKKKGATEESSKHNMDIGWWQWIEDGLAVLESREVAAKDNKKRGRMHRTYMVGESSKNSKRQSILMEEDFVQIIKKEEFVFSCKKKKMASTLKIENLSLSFDCSICMETKQPTESFTVKPCWHKFCISCVGRYVAAKVEENVSRIGCPDPECNDGILGLEMCRHIIPETVLDRWGVVLCESALGTKRFYCPFNDCSALLVHEEDSNQNGVVMITNSECPHCHRMFCAQCKVPWHDDISCEAFQQLGEDERGKDDLLLRKLAADKQWQRCPMCRMYVEKSEGCRFMRCRCGYCFCYGCASPMSEQSHYCTKCRR